MKNPYEVLGVKPGADTETIRAAYHAKAKTCHPDLERDPERIEAAQQQLVGLNLAYEAALGLSAPMNHSSSPYNQPLPAAQAEQLAINCLKQDNPRTALRQLQRAQEKDARWFALHGQILMRLHEDAQAYRSLKEAIHLEPDNLDYRIMALDAAIALKKSSTLRGRLRKLFRRKN